MLEWSGIWGVGGQIKVRLFVTVLKPFLSGTCDLEGRINLGGRAIAMWGCSLVIHLTRLGFYCCDWFISHVSTTSVTEVL